MRQTYPIITSAVRGIWRERPTDRETYRHRERENSKVNLTLTVKNTHTHTPKVSPTVVGGGAVRIADVIIWCQKPLRSEEEHTQHGSHTHTHTQSVSDHKDRIRPYMENIHSPRSGTLCGIRGDGEKLN